MYKGYVSLILHAHLPYVNHPEYKTCLEERWLFEAISETYIPLLNIFQGFAKDNIEFNVTMSITPTLCAMLSNPLLQEKYLYYLNNLIELCQKEIIRTKLDPDYNALAQMYLNKYEGDKHAFNDIYNRNILSGFKHFFDNGNLEIITCGATHGFLPLLRVNKESIRAQIDVGVQSFTEFFGRYPRGIWLPECAYCREVEEFLLSNSIEYIITESHGVLYADPHPIYGTFAPIVSSNGLIAFGRDIESSKQVWSANEGYPGDYDYRDFYRDIGYDLDYDYIKPYICEDGSRLHTGIKYHRITSKSDCKEIYHPDWAEKKAEIHAKNFVFNREQQIKYLSDNMDVPPIIVCPYDAELFGHWWYEGPRWLDHLFRAIAHDQSIFSTITPPQYLDSNSRMQMCSICESSWGYKGYNEVWLNGSNDWIYRHLHKASEKMTQLVEKFPKADGLLRLSLNQALRELLLAQSSDWAFIMKTGTMVNYAVKRTTEHLENFNRIFFDANNNCIDEKWINDINKKNNIFPNINYEIYEKIQ